MCIRDSHGGRGQILIEVLACTGREHVDRIDREPATEDPLLAKAVSETQPWLEVIQVPLCQKPLGMEERADTSCQGIDGSGVELALLVVFSRKGRFILPPNTEVQG